jgi:hypothetical protein
LNFLSPMSNDSLGLIFIDGIYFNPFGLRNSIEAFLFWKAFLFFYLSAECKLLS